MKVTIKTKEGGFVQGTFKRMLPSSLTVLDNGKYGKLVEVENSWEEQVESLKGYSEKPYENQIEA